jgi:hypothetical protein
MFNYSDIYIHDLSEVGVRLALEKYGALRPMKWDGGFVDFTYTSNVIEHVNDPSEFVLRLTEVSNRHILIQCPWDERGQNGGHITPKEPQGEHVWTIDQEFLVKHIPTVDWIQSGGGRGIRTHETFLFTGFQDQLHRPLGQTSV